MSRRQVLVGAGGVAALWGAFVLLSGRGPTATVREFVAATDDVNRADILSLLHPEAPMRDYDADTRRLDPTDDWQIQKQSVVEQSDGRIRLKVTFGSDDPAPLRIESRKHEGEWRIYDWEPA